MTVTLWVIAALAALVVALVVAYTRLSVALKREDDETVGLAYYGRSRAGREAYAREVAATARRLRPLLRLLPRLDFARGRMTYQGVSAPTGSCSPASFAAAQAYVPGADDVFVVTQMKCGTTWMQHVVYQVLHRGTGDLVATGTALYAVAPWLEGRRSVPMAQAPLVGTARRARLIKTHLPASLCPASDTARYIYVARHPVACFASCIDFVDTNLGTLAPGIPAFETWFTSPDLMWWGTWADHVRGWWQRAQGAPNVLVVTFEEMKRDLAGVAVRVAAFLGVAPLSPGELARVVHTCSFAYMQEHQAMFEMHPPHLLQSSAALFVSGAADRYKHLPPDVRGRIAAWAARELRGSGVPLAEWYPDVAAADEG